MSFRRSQHRVVVVFLVLLLTVGCGMLPRDTEVPSDGALPEESVSTVLPSETPVADPTEPVAPVTDVLPTATPQAEVPSYEVILVSPVGVQVEIPEMWVSQGAGTVWSPAPDDARQVGVARADLLPPAEAEAVLLPENAQILESEAVETPLGTGRQFRLEVYGATVQGDDAKAAVASIEMHVLVVVEGDGSRTGFDFFATAPTEQALESVMPVLSHMVETAKVEGAVVLPEEGYAGIPAVAAAKMRLGEDLSISTDTMRVVSAEAVDWSDACIGIHRAGQMCAQVITPGYRIIVDVDGQRYELHTDASGSVVGIVP